jgi:hydroxylamine dehydrogenase
MLRRKRLDAFIPLAVGLAFLLSSAHAWAAAAPQRPKPTMQEIAFNKECLDCHATESPGIVAEWKKSRHAGKDGVGCYGCHQAREGDPGAYQHHKHEGAPMYIQTIVTPKRCAICHEKEVAQQERSHHAKAGRILASLDGILGEVIVGPQAVNAGCRQCHGGQVTLDSFNRPTPQTWPNTGIGRINPDGTLGSCAACHGRHRFSVAQARTPDTCGKCHLGPDHPQLEIYNESKHGIIYRAKEREMNLDARTWVVGKDYTAAPTCATCHMSATPDQENTHDVGERISYTLRPPISEKQNLVRLANGSEEDVPISRPTPQVGEDFMGSQVAEVITWQQLRKNMKDVCLVCHASRTVDSHYQQFDELVDLYNDKFAKPISAVMKELYDNGYLTAAPFDEKIEWTWYEIWHHEGRRARHGAAMNGPDYTWWQGMYEVAKYTYFEWIPELKDVVRKKDGNEDFANALLEKHFKPIAGHDWYFNGISKDTLENVRKFYAERYGQTTSQ